MIKKLLLIFIFISFNLLRGQDENTTVYGVLPTDIPTHNLVKYNRFYFNPTFSLVRENERSINVHNKIQWAGFNDNPQTFLINYTGNFDEQIGVSIGLHQQNEGIYRYFGGIANFAYMVELNRDMKLTFGMNLGFSQSGIKSNIDAPTSTILNNGIEVNDPFILNYENSSVFQLTPGVNFNYEEFDAGISVANLVAYNLTGSELLTDKMAFTGHVMYTRPLQRRSDNTIRAMGYVNLLPKFDTETETNSDPDAEAGAKTVSSLRYGANAIVELPELGWAHAGYNSFYGASLGVGGNITSNVSIGYTYETGFGDTSNFGATHEVTLAYNFERERPRRRSKAKSSTQKSYEARDSEIRRLKKEILEQNKLIRELQNENGEARSQDKKAISELEKSIAEAKEKEAKAARELELQREEEVKLLNKQSEEEERLRRKRQLEQENAFQKIEEERLAAKRQLEQENAFQKTEEERLEAQRQLEQEQQIAREEAEREAEAAKQQAEEERIAAQKEAEEEAEAIAQQAEEQRNAAQREAEEAQKAEEERVAAAQKKLEEEAAAQKVEEERLEAQRQLEVEMAEQKAEEERLAAQKQLEQENALIKAEEERLASQKRLEQENTLIETEEERLAAQKQLEQENALIKAEEEEEERLAAQKQLEQENALIKAQEEERLRQEAVEAARLAEEERVRQEAAEAARLAEEKAQEEAAAVEAARLAEEERLRQEAAEAARLAEEERLRQEAAEAARLAEEERLRQEAAEAARLAEEERLRQEAAEAARLAEEERLRQEAAEAARLAEEERLRQEAAEAARLAEEERLRQEAAEAARLAEEKAQEEAAAAEAARLAEEERLRQETAEAARLAEEERVRQEAAEAARLAEEERVRQEAAAAEAARLAEEKAQEEAAAAEAARLAEEQRAKEEAEAAQVKDEGIEEIKKELDNSSRITNKIFARRDSLLTTSLNVDKREFSKLLESLVDMNDDAEEAKKNNDPSSSKRLTAKNRFVKFAETSRPEAQFATKYIPGYPEGYYLIGNVFKGGVYADRFTEKLKDIGFDNSQIIVNPENQFQYVAIESFTDKDEAAEKYLNNIDNRYFGDMWILHIAKSRVESYKKLLQETRLIKDTVKDDTVLTENLSFIGGHNIENGYYLITNIFKRENYFERGMEKLRSQGLEPQYFRNPKDNYIYIYLKRFDTIDEAKQTLFSNVNNSYDGDLYILKVQ